MTHSVVIGGSGGLGSAVRAAFAARGDAVTALSRSSDMPCDLTEPRQIWAALNAVTLGNGNAHCNTRVATGLQRFDVYPQRWIAFDATGRVTSMPTEET